MIFLYKIQIIFKNKILKIKIQINKIINNNLKKNQINKYQKIINILNNLKKN